MLPGVALGAAREARRHAVGRALPPGRATVGAGGAGAVRWLHKGHVGKTLEKLNLPRHKWLKEVNQAPEKSVIRRQKDKYLRELGVVHRGMQGLFDDDAMARKAVEPLSEMDIRTQAGSTQRREDVNEAMRMYRLLQPDAAPFYEEDAVLGMRAKMNKVLLDDKAGEDAVVPGGSKFGDPFKAYLPVVNQRAFLLALESVTASLAEDVETMCLLAGLAEEHLPAEDDPLRFKGLLGALFGAFPLRKDPSRVEEFMRDSWPRLRMLLPEELSSMPEERVKTWLRGHLQRVRLNQRRLEPSIFLHSESRNEEWYSFAEDFPYDDDPMPGLLADERNLDFPLEGAAGFMRSILAALSRSPVAAEAERAGSAGEVDGEGDVAAQFQDFVWDLEKIGLRNWLKMDVADLERFLPKGALAELSLSGEGKGTIPIGQEDVEVAKLMLRCAARGRANLLDFEALDPYKLLHGLPAREVDAELAELSPNAHVSDAELTLAVDAHTARLERNGRRRAGARAGAPDTDAAWLREGATIDELYRKELDFYRTAGPVEWSHDESDGYTWKWRQPPNTFWDDKRKVYIQEQKGVDPNLDLSEMRQHTLDITRMGSMTKMGRIKYFRSMVVVGNGKGVYGFGVGFGNTPKEARADGVLRALQNLDYVDVDSGRMMTTPVKGHEYKHVCSIIPRPIGRGLQVNKKFLPLVHILGLDNCKVKFMHSKWFTRVKALKRALDMMMSRRTLANMTGKRYALLVAPGDHWVHWPDRWFDQVRQPYDARDKRRRLSRRHALHHRRRPNVMALPEEVRPGWRRDNWARWNSPLDRWLQEDRGEKYKGTQREEEALPGSGAASAML